MTKKNSGNIREGDIREHNPARKVRIDNIRKDEADNELKEYLKHKKEWDEENQGYCCDWDTK